MAESKRKSKKKGNNPFEGLTTVSRTIYFLIKWIAIIGTIIVAFRLILSPMISKLTHKMCDHDKWLQLYDKYNKKSDGYVDVFIPKSVVPHTKTWSGHVDNTLMFDKSTFITQFIIVLVVLLVGYVLTMLLRHRKGEMTPFTDDMASKHLKRRVIRNIGAGRRTQIDEENKEIKNLERIARFRLRLMRIEIHTSYQKGSVKPVKSYYVRISRVRNNDEVNERVLKKIKNLDESLSSLTNVSFGARGTSSDQRFYTFNGDKEFDKVKESIFVKWRRRKARKETGSDTGSEYAFPLTLFTDNSSKIDDKREKAEAKAEEFQESVRVYLLSEKIQANTSDAFTGNTSVQLQYALPSYMTSLPNLESLQTGINASLNIQGTLVTLRGSKLNIVVPLPDDCVIPIDVKSMIEAEF